MSKRIIHSAQIAATYIGAIIGAGFASGQEILLFFALYRWWGLAGIAVSTLLFSFFGSFVLVSSDRLGVRSYADLLTAIVGPRFIFLFDLAACLMLLLGTGVMLVGSGVVGQEFLGVPKLWGVAFMYLAVAVVTWGGKDRVKLANTLLVPALIIITAFLCIRIIILPSGFTLVSVPIAPAGGNWFLASLLYVSYNMLAGFVVLSSIYRHNEEKANAQGGLWGGLGLGVLAAFIILAEMKMLPRAAQFEAPMLYLASFSGPWGGKIYALVLWIAMFTTAIGNILGLTQRLAQSFRVPARALIPIVLTAVLPLLPFTFSDLIRYLYQIFGYLGFLLLGALTWAAFRQAQKGNRIF